MKIRKAAERDIPHILEIYSIAKEYMKNEGNTTQWDENYPSIETIEEDIEKKRLYVIESEESVAAVFVFTLEKEEAYEKIDGEWHYDSPYAVIHRVAKDSSAHGITKLIYNYALEKIPYLRVDTHRDNITMRRALTKFGFTECGIVYYQRGGEKTERIAYDYHSL